MTIKRHSVWWDKSHPDFVYQSQLPTYADVVIIGAGFAGMSTAFWLAKLSKSNTKPVRILVLDQAPHAAFKASGRMNGSIYLGSNRPAIAVAEQLGETTAHKLFNYSVANNRLLQGVLGKLGCESEFNGGLRMASTAKEVVELEASQKLLSKWDLNSVFFNQDQSQHLAIMPLIKGSLFIPGEGMFDPFRFTNDIARALRLYNVWVCYGSRVISTSNAEDGSPQIYLENGHVISAGKLVHATSRVLQDESVTKMLVYRRETVVSTEAISAELDDMPLPLMPIELNQGLDSARVYNRAVIMTGGKAGLRKQDPEADVFNDSSINQRILDHLDSTMTRNFPFSNHTEVDHAWTYIEADSQDGLPFIGELLSLPGQFVNIAHGRNKFGLAFLAAKNIAERVLRLKVQESDFNIFAPKRLTRGE